MSDRAGTAKKCLDGTEKLDQNYGAGRLPRISEFQQERTYNYTNPMAARWEKVANLPSDEKWIVVAWQKEREEHLGFTLSGYQYIICKSLYYMQAGNIIDTTSTRPNSYPNTRNLNGEISVTW